MTAVSELPPQQETDQKPEKFATIYEAFEHYLGFPFPESPQELPEELLLRPEVYGGLLDAVLAQQFEDHHLRPTPVERNQYVGRLNSKGEPINSIIRLGTANRVDDATPTLKRWIVKPFLGERVKSLTYWHTHTKKAYSQHLTESDVTNAISDTERSCIYAHASETTISVIIQTRKGIPESKPLSMIMRGNKLYDELKLMYDSGADRPQLHALAYFLDKYGYALYVWDRPKSIDSSSPTFFRRATVREAFEAGHFTNGIRLRKVPVPPPREEVLEDSLFSRLKSIWKARSAEV